MSDEKWQVLVQGIPYDSDLETLKGWLIEGRVQPTDRVQKGTLPWTAARNVPALREACAQSQPPPHRPQAPVENHPPVDLDDHPWIGGVELVARDDPWPQACGEVRLRSVRGGLPASAERGGFSAFHRSAL